MGSGRKRNKLLFEFFFCALNGAGFERPMRRPFRQRIMSHEDVSMNMAAAGVAAGHDESTLTFAALRDV